jgi:single-strand DNA-binding protein
MNKVILMGNLGADPELRTTTNGTSVATLRLATNERFTDKSGKSQQRTSWHRVVVWAKSAENCAKFLHKGSRVSVEGRLDNRSWDDKAGQKHWVTEIVANVVTFLDTKAQSSEVNLPELPPLGDEAMPGQEERVV